METGDLKFKINCDTAEAKKEVEDLIFKLKSVRRLVNPNTYFWLGFSVGVNVLFLYLFFYFIVVR
jgi:hypothetical protein